MSSPEPLAARVAALEAEVAALRVEVRTERVVVADAHGVARVVLSAAASTGSVLVRLPGPPGATTGLELYASEVPGEAPAVGVCHLRDGEVVADGRVLGGSP